MIARIVLAWFHLMALGIGLAAIWTRARALDSARHTPDDTQAIDRALVADAWWGVAALIWFASGLWRLLGGTEKATSYYFANMAFTVKMTCFVIIVALEIWPMITLMRWRRNDKEPNVRDGQRIETISYVQCLLVIVMVFAAVTMARGYGMR